MMYAIIYWCGDYCYPVLNINHSLKLFDTLKDADTSAYLIENDITVEARVISIECVEKLSYDVDEYEEDTILERQELSDFENAEFYGEMGE
jgi:hypothetical protein